MSSADSTAPTETTVKPIVGTGMARFLNQYNPEYDQPFRRTDNNRGQYIDPDLAKELERERQSAAAKQHNKRKDWMKNYMDECVKFQSITKAGSKSASK